MFEKLRRKIQVVIWVITLGISQTLTQSAVASMSSDLKTAADLVEKSQDAQGEKLLNQIIAKANGEDKNQAILIFGRMKFQEKKFNEAIVVYKQIPSTSKFWVEALEERAWAALHIGDFERALSLYNTLSSQALSENVGPEAFLIGAIADLRICNYKGIFDDLKLFKERFRPRIQNLNKNIASNSSKQSLQEIQAVIKKMHIIEIEAIQRMGLKRQAGGDFSKVAERSEDTIRFPKESEEWLDEAKFDVAAKHCALKSTQLSTSQLNVAKSGVKK